MLRKDWACAALHESATLPVLQLGCALSAVGVWRVGAKSHLQGLLMNSQ
jgi:hypothetical protein